MKKIYLAALALGALLLGIMQKPQKTVAIIQVIDHPALNQTRKGLEDAIQLKDVKCVYESAQGNPALASQIAQKYSQATVIVTLGTMPSQMAMKATKTTPIVFASVTDPSLLVKNFKSPESNITGVSNYVAIRKQLLYFQSLQPSLKNLGVVFNPGEANSVKQMEELRKEAKKLGINIIQRTATKVSEVATATQSLLGKIDAFLVISDNTSLSAYDSIVRIADKTPVYVADVDCLEKGGTAALGCDQYALGQQAGEMVKKIIKGSIPSLIPIEWPKIILKKIKKD